VGGETASIVPLFTTLAEEVRWFKVVTGFWHERKNEGEQNIYRRRVRKKGMEEITNIARLWYSVELRATKH
jgi:hypothetical protein